MFQDNNWYGHRRILLDYCKIKQDYNSLSSIQHGWNNFTSRKSLGKRKLKNFIPYLCWSNEVKKMMSSDKSINTHIIGSPFIYLHELKKNNFFNSKGTIVFPSHSTPEIDVILSHKKLIEIVEKQEKGPYTVCLYYTDYKKKNINIYKKKKWNIICCGNRANKNFLYKLYHYIGNSNTIVCTELTSPLFYAMYLNKRARIIKNFKKNNKVFSLSKVEMWIHEIEGYKYFKKRYPKIFKKGLKLKEGKKLANIELGGKYLRSRKFIKKIMGWDNIFKIILAKFFAFLIDLKYGNNLRNGKAIRAKFNEKEYHNLYQK
jgi:hypothetical protein